MGRAQLDALGAGVVEARAPLDDVSGITSEDESVEDAIGDEPRRRFVVACVDAPLYASHQLRIDLERGQMQASDFTGSLTLNVERGTRALLTRLSGSVLIDAIRTNVVLSDARIDGDSDIALDRGDLDLELAGSQPLTIDAEVSSRANLRNDLPVTLQQSGARYQATLEGGGPALRIRADEGEVRLRSN